jgi:hypothetical protein
MRKILLAAAATISIAFAAAPLTMATWSGETASSASTVQINAAGGYHHARVLQPGSRGSVVEI